jgi:hypothetical protein
MMSTHCACVFQRHLRGWKSQPKQRPENLPHRFLGVAELAAWHY